MRHSVHLPAVRRPTPGHREEDKGPQPTITTTADARLPMAEKGTVCVCPTKERSGLSVNLLPAPPGVDTYF
jgi:hypothetical protein